MGKSGSKPAEALGISWEKARSTRGNRRSKTKREGPPFQGWLRPSIKRPLSMTEHQARCSWGQLSRSSRGGGLHCWMAVLILGVFSGVCLAGSSVYIQRRAGFNAAGRSAGAAGRQSLSSGFWTACACWQLGRCTAGRWRRSCCRSGAGVVGG